MRAVYAGKGLQVAQVESESELSDKRVAHDEGSFHSWCFVVRVSG